MCIEMREDTVDDFRWRVERFEWIVGGADAVAILEGAVSSRGMMLMLFG